MSGGQLVPYEHLSADERATLDDWFDAHGVNHRRIPIHPEIHIDGSTVRVRIYDERDGKMYLTDEDEVATRVVSFEASSPMPWREYPEVKP